jgi:hypothetical protein
MRSSIVVVLFWSFACALHAQSSAPVLEPTWSATLPTAIVDVALAFNERCVAILTKESVEVRDATGTVLWQWRFPWQVVVDSYYRSGVAVSDQCDVVAFRGVSEYRYVWMIERSGQRRYFGTRTSTPTALAFNHRGTRLAIGTGAGELILLGRDARPVFRQKLAQWACCMSELTFDPRDRFVLAESRTHVGLYDATSGRIRWSRHFNAISAAPDFTRFIAVWTPWHGAEHGEIRRIDRTGRLSSWEVRGDWALISPTRDEFVAMRYQDQQQDIGDGWELCLLSVDGSVITRLPGYRLAAFSSDGDRILMDERTEASAVDRQGRVQWTIPMNMQTSSIRTHDLKVVVVFDGDMLRWYEPSQ